MSCAVCRGKYEHDWGEHSARALERIAVAMEARAAMEARQIEANLKAVEEFKARTPGPGSSLPDWNRVQAEMMAALMRRVGVPEEDMPAIPEDPAEIPAWLQSLGTRGPGPGGPSETVTGDDSAP